jgi:hypothetical protein
MYASTCICIHMNSYIHARMYTYIFSYLHTMKYQYAMQATSKSLSSLTSIAGRTVSDSASLTNVSDKSCTTDQTMSDTTGQAFDTLGEKLVLLCLHPCIYMRMCMLHVCMYVCMCSLCMFRYQRLGMSLRHATQPDETMAVSRDS